MHFENLTHVHPRRHAERIQHDVGRTAIGHVRHVFDRHDLRHDTLVTVTAGHLVARLQTTLHSQIHLDHLQHARRQFVALRELLPLCLEHGVELAPLLRDRLLERLDLRCRLFVGEADVEPVVFFDRLKVGLADLGALGELFRPAVGRLAGQQALEALEGVGLDDPHLVGEVSLIVLELFLDDALAALVALDAFAREHLHVDDAAGDA